MSKSDNNSDLSKSDNNSDLSKSDNESKSQINDNKSDTNTDFDSSEDEEDEETKEETLNYFKECIKCYLKLEGEIKILERATKARKEKKKNYSDSILSFIQSKDISHVKLQGSHQGKQMECQSSTKKSNVPFKKVIETIVEHFENPEDASTLINKINSNRTESKKNVLRIGKPSKKKNNSKTLNNIINDNTSKLTNTNINTDTNIPQVPESMEYLFTTIHNVGNGDNDNNDNSVDNGDNDN